MPSLVNIINFGLLALATAVHANPLGSPLEQRGECAADNCARFGWKASKGTVTEGSNLVDRAVTGTNAPQPLETRKADCSKFFAAPTATVPTYASACSGTVRYSSACSCFGVPSPTATCLSAAQATDIASKFALLLTEPQSPEFPARANALLADSFTDTSDSINFLAGIPLGAVTFPSKQAFIGGQGAQPPIPTVETLDVFNTCNKIAWRWVGRGIGNGQFQVKGINTFTVTPAGQISEVFAEFNSGAWLAALGNPQCPA